MIEDDAGVYLLAPKSDLYYYDKQTITLPRRIDPVEAWNAIVSHPRPLLSAAFRIRDLISAMFGVKPIKGFRGAPAAEVTVGGMLDFFLVEARTPDQLALTSRDVHLDVMTCLSSSGAEFSITSSVMTHNWFGRAYMIPVGVAHRIIVRKMLKELRASLAKEAPPNGCGE